MKKNDEEIRQAESLEKSLEILFGREADLTDAELDEELDACGINAVELQTNVHKKLLDHANHHYRTVDRDVPENLENIIRGLRPPSTADRAKAVVRNAEKLLDSFLDIAKTKSADLSSPVSPAQSRNPQFAFRNKKDLSTADKDLLESEQEDVDSSQG